MPAESRKDHSDVRPRNSHSGDVRFDETEKGIGKNGDVIYVPWILRVLVHGMCFKCGHGARRWRVRIE